jgi:two-component system response regulator YesN
MVQILLVDDEDIELQGLVAMIHTFDLPIAVCATARSGFEGLEKAQALKPDIILTDLRMPKMTGIEMLQKVKLSQVKAQTILMSGYEDFDAAREALELGTVAYLLKPIGREELVRSLSKCCAGIGFSINSPSHAQKEIREYKEEEEHLVRQLLFTSETKIDALLHQAPAGDFESEKLFSVATLQLPSQQNLDMFDCVPFLRRFARQHNSPAPVLIDNTRAVLVLNTPNFVGENAFIDAMTSNMEKLILDLYALGLEDIVIGISDVGCDAREIPLLYKQSILALSHGSHSISRILFHRPRENSLHLESQLIGRIQDIIQKEYATALSIEIISEKVFFSPSHIRRLFKSQTGVTIMDYLESVRMERARVLLSQCQYRIHEISGMVGYESPSYFNMVFKKNYGQTPGEYRKSLGL